MNLAGRSGAAHRQATAGPPGGTGSTLPAGGGAGIATGVECISPLRLAEAAIDRLGAAAGLAALPLQGLWAHQHVLLGMALTRVHQPERWL